MYTHTVNGGWSDWRPGKCSVTCGSGLVRSTRECNNPIPANGGRYCVGPHQDVKRCNKGCCPGTNKLDRIVQLRFNKAHHVLVLVAAKPVKNDL